MAPCSLYRAQLFRPWSKVVYYIGDKGAIWDKFVQFQEDHCGQSATLLNGIIGQSDLQGMLPACLGFIG
jgi:hypothetical protein